jgi:hypothetical protein
LRRGHNPHQECALAQAAETSCLSARMQLPTEEPIFRATALQGTPWSRSCWTFNEDTYTFGRPIRTPRFRAAAMPAERRSRINSGSNFAMAPSRCIISRPDGVLRSKLSRRLTKRTHSSSGPRLWCRLRPRRSSFHTTTASNARACAALRQRLSSGRDSFDPLTPRSTYSPAISQPLELEVEGRVVDGCKANHHLDLLGGVDDGFHWATAAFGADGLPGCVGMIM